MRAVSAAWAAVVLGAGPIGVLTAHALRARGAERLSSWSRTSGGEHGWSATTSRPRRLDGVHERVIELGPH